MEPDCIKLGACTGRKYHSGIYMHKQIQFGKEGRLVQACNGSCDILLNKSRIYAYMLKDDAVARWSKSQLETLVELVYFHVLIVTVEANLNQNL